MQDALGVDAATEALEELHAALGGKETAKPCDQITSVYGLLPSLPDGLN